MLFQPHWKLDGGRMRRLARRSRKSGTRFSHSVHHDSDFEPGQVHAEAEVLAAAERQQRSIGRFQMNSSGSAYSRSSRAADAEQRDDPLPRLDRGVVDRERFAHRSGEPLRGRAEADHLLARDGTLASRSARTAANWSGRRLSSHSPCATIFGTVSVPPMKTPSIWVATSTSLNAEPSGNR